jgi:hypothetical protein
MMKNLSNDRLLKKVRASLLRHSKVKKKGGSITQEGKKESLIFET